MRITGLILAVLLVSAAVHAEVTIDTCGQVIPPHQVGALAADLDCTAASAGTCAYDLLPCAVNGDCEGSQACMHVAVSLSRGSTLRLDSHTLTGPQASYGFGAYCARGRCTIAGPGTIVGGSNASIFALPNWRARLDLRQLELVGNGQSGFGVDAIGSRVEVTDVTATHFVQAGIYAQRLRATNVSVSNNTFLGIAGTLTLVATNLTSVDNGGNGVYAGKFRIEGLTATGNRAGGLYSVRGGGLRRSTVVNNTWKSMPMDILAFRTPILTQVTCDWSGRRPQNIFVDEITGPLGVCAAS